MTFPFLPHRSSSDDDALDQQLNDWVGRSASNPEPAGDHAADALAFHRWANETRRSDPAATGPAAGTWNRVLRNSAQESPKGRRKMSTAVLASQPHGFEKSSAATVIESVRHYSKLVATIAIVLAVALGGWLAMSQLSPGGEGRFALIGQTDSGTCDVEPMTVDEVMEIAENPYRYLNEGEYPPLRSSTTDSTPWDDDYQEVQPNLPSTIGMGNGDEPTQVAFDQASAVISRFITCLQVDGSVAMMLRFADPFSIQHHIRMEFPFYRTEDQVRTYVAEWLQSGETYYSLTTTLRGETRTFRQSDQKSIANTQIHDFGLGFDQIMYVGTEVYDENGSYLGDFHPIVRQIAGQDPDFGLVFTLIRSRYTAEWYIVIESWVYSTSSI